MRRTRATQRLRQSDADALRGVSARRVAEILRRYGVQTTRIGGRSVYRDTLAQLKLIEERYGVDLNTSGRENINVLRVARY